MSYLNNITGYRDSLLSNRSVIRPGLFAIIEPDGIVRNVIPGFENCDTTILGSPKLGASFVDYLVTVHPGGGHRAGFGEEGVEVLLYLIEGDLTVRAGETPADLTAGGYIFCPPGTRLTMENRASADARAFLYKRRYRPLAGHEPYVVTGNLNDTPWRDFEGMTDARMKDMLPTDDLAFDCNFHILSFKPGASHGYIETHVQEHGALCLSGQGMYNLDNQWFPVQKGDYIFMGAYSLQACYAVGRDEEFSYVYSKDCNRDVEL